MGIHLATMIYFSPTGTTQRVLEGIVRGIQVDRVTTLDLTLPAAGTREFEAVGGDLVLIGAPVYGGRIPAAAERRLRRLRGNDTPAVVVVLYGNREYEDALLELRDLALDLGFKPFAGGAFIGEHSFSSPEVPIAHGRPDAEDLRQAAAFGRMIREKMGDVPALETVQVPGDLPYKARGKPFGISPVTRGAACTQCADCAAVCPTAAITVGDAVVTDVEACISCCACVKACPTGARVMDHPRVQRATKWLSTDYRERKEPEMYT